MKIVILGDERIEKVALSKALKELSTSAEKNMRVFLCIPRLDITIPSNFHTLYYENKKQLRELAKKLLKVKIDLIHSFTSQENILNYFAGQNTLLILNARTNNKIEPDYYLEDQIGNLSKVYKTLIIRKRFSQKLTKTGWQSWSVKTKNRIWLFNHRDYPPRKDPSIINSLKGFIAKPKITGWCSWYAFCDNIDEQKILKQSKFIAKSKNEFPLEYILIDDGWTSWGDWDKVYAQRFPSGLASLCEKILRLGLKPGIWIAPFLVDPNSEVAQNHPDWIVKRGKKAIDGFRLLNPLIDRFMPYKKYILDMTNKEVQTYLNQTIDLLLAKNKFELIKLDFLYAPHFDPRLKSKQANQIIHNFAKGIRERNPGIHIIGCGMPLVPAVGAIDSMRIGPDTIAPNLDRVPVLRKLFNTLKVRKTIRAIRQREWTKIYWNIDPDAFVCRKNTGISDRLLLKLQKSIIEAKGNLFLGDDLTKLPKERIEKFIKPLFNPLSK